MRLFYESDDLKPSIESIVENLSLLYAITKNYGSQILLFREVRPGNLKKDQPRNNISLDQRLSFLRLVYKIYSK